MPQLDTVHYSSQLFWLAITFIALYVVLWKVVLPRIGGTLAQRQTRIDADLERAAELREEADAVMASYEAQFKTAREKAQRELRAVLDAAQAEADRRQQALTDKLHADMVAAEQRIAAARNAAIANLGDVAVELAGDIAGRLGGAAAAPNDVRAAVDGALKATENR